MLTPAWHGARGAPALRSPRRGRKTPLLVAPFPAVFAFWAHCRAVERFFFFYRFLNVELQNFLHFAMFLQTAQHKPRRSRSQTPPRRQRLFWLSAGKAAETKVKTSGRMATARCGSAQLGAAPPALSPPPFSTGSSGQGALPHVPPAGHRVRRPLRGALPGHFPSSHNPPPSKPPSVLPNLLRTTKKIPLFPLKKATSRFPPAARSFPSQHRSRLRGAPGRGFFGDGRGFASNTERPTRSSPWVQNHREGSPQSPPQG